MTLTPRILLALALSPIICAQAPNPSGAQLLSPPVAHQVPNPNGAQLPQRPAAFLNTLLGMPLACSFENDPDGSDYVYAVVTNDKQFTVPKGTVIFVAGFWMYDHEGVTGPGHTSAVMFLPEPLQPTKSITTGVKQEFRCRQ